MYAVIESGNQQHRIQVGDLVRVDRLEGEVGATVTFDRVLLVGDGDTARVGTPTIAGVQVRGSIVSQVRAKKVFVRTFKHRSNSSRRQLGHRQHLTTVRIDAIEG